MTTAEPMIGTAEQVADLIAGCRFRYSSETELQAGIAAALAAAGYSVEREVRLTERDRIDLMVGPQGGRCVGVEVKLAGSCVDVARQMQRYAHHPRVAALLLVTRRVAHRSLPATLGGVPLQVVVLGSVV